MVNQAYAIAQTRGDRDHAYALKLGGVLTATALAVAVPNMARANNSNVAAGQEVVDPCAGQDTYLNPVTIKGDGLVGVEASAWTDCSDKLEGNIIVLDGQPVVFEGLGAYDAKTGEPRDAYIEAVGGEVAERLLDMYGGDCLEGNLIKAYVEGEVVSDSTALAWFNRLAGDGEVTAEESGDFQENVPEGVLVCRYVSADQQAGLPFLVRTSYEDLAAQTAGEKETETQYVPVYVLDPQQDGLRFRSEVSENTSFMDLSLTQFDTPLEFQARNVTASGLEQEVYLKIGQEEDSSWIEDNWGWLVVGGAVVGGIIYLSQDCEDCPEPPGLEGGENPHDGVE